MIEAAETVWIVTWLVARAKYSSQVTASITKCKKPKPLRQVSKTRSKN